MSDIRRYRTDYIELETEDIKHAGYVLEHILTITDFKVISDTVIEIYELKRPVREISEALVRNGVGITGIGKKQSSLEDYFFHVIGEV